MPTAADRPNAGVAAAGVAGCILAVVVGAATGIGRGPQVGGALLGLAIVGTGVAVYLRDPVRGLMWLWVAVVLNAPLAVLAGYDSAAGQKIRQADEILVLLLVVLTAWRTFRNGSRLPWRFLLPAIGVAALGLLSAVANGVPFSVSVPGAWLGLKLWIMVVVALLLPWRPDDIERVWKVVMTMGLVVATLGFAEYLTGGAILDVLHLQGLEVLSENPRADAVHSIFYHAGEYSLFMSIVFAFAFARYAGTRSNSDLAIAVLFAASVLLSLRLKGFLSLAAVVAIVALAQAAIRGNRGVAAALVGALLVIGAYSVQASVINTQLTEYTSSQETARGKLYEAGQQIAEDNFPLGAGFGRYASYQSRLSYSPLYDQYGLSNTWGLSRRDPQFIDDTSWPSVIGETGLAGFLAYCMGLALLVWALARRLINSNQSSRWIPLAALCVLVVLIVNSLGDPSLFNWIPAASLALLIGPALVATQPRSGSGSAPAENPSSR